MPPEPSSQRNSRSPFGGSVGDLEIDLNSTPNAAIAVDTDLVVRSANTAAGELLQLDPLVGLDAEVVLSRFHDRQEMLADLRLVIATGNWSQRETRLGDTRWFLKRIIPLGDGAAPSGAVLTFEPINRAKSVQARLQLAISAARLVWWDWDFTTGVIAVYGDPTCILGYTFETLPRTPQQWFDRTHPDDSWAVNTALEACMDGREQEWSVIHRLRAADGSWRWVHNCGRLGERDEQGRPLRMLGITRDVHESHEALLALQRDAAILSQLGDAVLSCDEAYKVLYVNDAFERILGWRREDIVGRHASERLPMSVRDEALGLMRRVMAGEKLDLEWEDFRRDGSRVWIHWRAQPLLSTAGRLVGTINVGTDISQRKEMESQRELLQRQLIQSQRMDTLGSLAGGIAHDFNNILAVIFGFTEIALTTTSSSDQSKHYHQQVLKASERARDLVKRILSFSRFHEPEKKPVELRDLVLDAAKFIRAALPTTIELQTEIESCPPTLADADQIHQVLLNLATNAAHAIGGRKGIIRLNLSHLRLSAPTTVATGDVRAGEYGLIRFSDTGRGMDEATKRRIFEPFFTTKKEGEGTGLGLPVVAAILRGHDGAIDVVSEVGKGTTFCIYIPVLAGVRPPSAPVDGASVDRTRARGEAIAIIDDEEMVATTAERSLQLLGYRTERFRDAAHFLSGFESAPAGIDLILTDQTMPNVTGLDLAVRLRERGCFVPILIMTGFSTQLRSELIEALENCAVIRKPFDRFELARTIRLLLDDCTGR